MLSVSSFIARQLIILVAGLIFLAYTYVRVRLNYERRDLATFVADVSKQAGQQAAAECSWWCSACCWRRGLDRCVVRR